MVRVRVRVRVRGRVRVIAPVVSSSLSYYLSDVLKLNYKMYSLFLQPYSWNDVMYFYDGTNFVAQTNGYKTQKPLGGKIAILEN